MYVDRDRGAGVTLGAADLTSDLKKKRKDEKIGSLQDNIDWTIYFKEGLADVARGKFEKALRLFNKVHTKLKHCVEIHFFEYLVYCNGNRSSKVTDASF